MGQGTSILGKLLGHYLVVEQIGAGGMGMVFRASDQQLERDVAIKVLPPGMLADESARKRFRREALTLAKLNHPNIGTVYEFGSQEDLDYLVMEYVGGVALDARLGYGALPPKDVLRLGFQLADGLASAHDHGVIHRDLKPANLRLTEDNRLKILDFGLAQFVRNDVDLGATASISENRKVSGTLPYMSPEQLRGETTDQRSDIWSAGAVLFELATGRRPFPSQQVPLLIDSILNKPPEMVSAADTRMSPGLEMAILKCLDKDPERRYQSARELRVDLDRLTMPISQVSGAYAPPVPATPVSEPFKIKPLAIAGAGIVLLLLVAMFSYLYFHTRAGQTAVSTPVSRRRTVAVLNLKNATSRPEAAWLSTGLAEMLTTELAAGEQLRAISGEEIAQKKRNLELADSDTLSPQILSQVGRSLGADLVVLGSYVDLPGGNLRLDLHLLDVAAGEILLSVKQIGDENNLFDLVSRAGAELREKCNAGQVTAAQETAVRATLPSTPGASKLYAEGLAKLRVGDAMAARDLLQKAVEADANHALAHSALAAAWSLLGYDEKARLAAKSAYDLSSSLSREDRLLIEARYRETSKEWDNAAEDYRTLFGFFPDNLEYGLLLARAQTRGGKGKDAATTTESLRKLAPPSGDDPRIELVASDAWQSLGDLKQSEDFARKAADKARAQNEKLLLARALYQQGFALEALSDSNGATTAVDEAGRIYQSVGDRYGLASTLEVTAAVLADRGDYSGALAKYHDELAIAEAVGNRKAEASALNNSALVLKQQGKEDDARKMFERSLSVFQEISDKSNYALTMINIAGIAQEDGDLNGAKKTFDQALTIFTEINDQNGEALSLAGIGIVLDKLGDSGAAKAKLEQAISVDKANGQANPATDKLIGLGDAFEHLGDLAGARQNYEAALSLARAASDKSTISDALTGLGNLESEAANFPQAHKDYDEALSLRNELDEKDAAAVTKTGIARLSTEENHPDIAQSAAREARDELQAAHKNDEQVAATAALSTALLAEGKSADAAKEIDRVSPLAAKSQNLSVQITIAIAKANAESASHQAAVAKSVLKQALAKATKSGYLGYQFECRLAIDEIDFASGKSPESRSQLEQLQNEAKEKGFGLIARKASFLIAK